MEWMHWLRTCLVVLPLVFLGGFVDAVAGGGGLITLPAYLIGGLPVHMAAGTNKFAASFGAVAATTNYARRGKVLWRVALVAGACSMAGGWVGSQLAMRLSEQVLRIALMAVLPPVAVFLATRKQLQREGEAAQAAMPRGREVLLSALIGFAIGCYDGLIGPGTGTFLILCFAGLLHMDLLTASGCAKVSNLASNLGSAIVFLLQGKVLFAVALPAALASTLGGMLGAKFALRGGNRRIRYVIFFVLGLMFVKVLLDALGVQLF